MMEKIVDFLQHHPSKDMSTQSNAILEDVNESGETNHVSLHNQNGPVESGGYKSADAMIAIIHESTGIMFSMAFAWKYYSSMPFNTVNRGS